MRTYGLAFSLALLAGCLPPFPDAPVPGPVTDADGDGYTVDDGDCDDADDAVHPDAAEVCDGRNNDCDADVDEDASDAPTWYGDADHDGFGDAAVTSCSQPPDTASQGGDCDDADPTSFPGNPELCDGADNDCDLDIDEEATDVVAWFQDLDGDGFGDPTVSVDACAAPPDFVADDTDCDDGAAAINPDGVEVCDAADADEDCDGRADDLDDAPGGASTWYVDADSDGWGDDSTAFTACDPPVGSVSRGEDCRDDDDRYNPDAIEDDCADPADYNCDQSTGFADADLDGWPACQDCNDHASGVNPDAEEVCDAADVDEDCDHASDDLDPEGPASGTIPLWADADKDGFGAGVAYAGCDVDAGESANGDDCDDTRAAVSPSGHEVCDALDLDEDCSGAADDADPSATGETSWYPDVDGDGYGDKTIGARLACDPLADEVAEHTDCDDLAFGVNPGEPEVCDPANVDEDCSGKADDKDPKVDPDSLLSFYLDGDGDGYGAPNTVREGCEILPGELAVGGDCDDVNPAIHPDAGELCDANDVDEDCDALPDDLDDDATGGTRWYADADADGAGDPAVFRDGCDPLPTQVATGDDCDDADAATWPGAPEQCDGVQNDCDAAWTDDAGTATWIGPSGPVSVTSLLAAGAPGSPVAYALPAGEVTLCTGTWDVALTASGVTTLRGLGGGVVLSGSGVSRPLTVDTTGDLTVSDLTLADGAGGALWVDGVANLSGVTLTTSTATTGGGAGVGPTGTLTADLSDFTANDADEGGGLYIAAGGVADLTDCTLSGNTALWGGGLWSEGDVSLTLSELSDNLADEGGAAYTDAGTAFADRTNLIANHADVTGGGWFVGGTAVVTDLNMAIEDNTAPRGAGGWLEGGTFSCSGLTANFSGNAATSSGGGFELIAGTLVSTACDWLTNTPDDIRTPAGSSSYGLNATFTCTTAGCL